MYVPSWRMQSSTKISCEQLPHIHTHTDIRFETLSNVERMLIDESPLSLLPLSVMLMDDDLPVHLSVYNSMFKQW